MRPKALLLIATLVHPSALAAQQPIPEWDPRGAVWCTYVITAMLGKVQETCLPDHATAKASLADSLAKHRAFVRRNTSETKASLAAFEAQQTDLQGTSCQTLETEGWLRMVEDIESDPMSYRAEIDEILSVDRKPLWNPCL
ncbi:hypothetical protein [uncultured Tateyamaria sp.]|uniref:hypothetical protein n=1 Tax=uncultured Tateyamaria sp. TaxID=455651 RepID=UPI002613F6DA|nr:hypothetical protein [uncultured Tateyamaria sp.]